MKLRIGYGRTWIAPRDTWIATISVGYADGFNRLFSNRGRVLINGLSYPVVGRVCMDQSMVDLGPDTDVRVGDEVMLIGKSGAEEITCNEWAQTLKTITYVVTCQINTRVERVFVSFVQPTIKIEVFIRNTSILMVNILIFLLDPAEQKSNDQDHKQEAKKARSSVAPTTAVWPNRQGT